MIALEKASTGLVDEEEAEAWSSRVRRVTQRDWSSDHPWRIEDVVWEAMGGLGRGREERGGMEEDGEEEEVWWWRELIQVKRARRGDGSEESVGGDDGRDELGGLCGSETRRERTGGRVERVSSSFCVSKQRIWPPKFPQGEDVLVYISLLFSV